MSFTFIDLFAGIGGIRIAFERVGGKCVFSSEWDKYAQISYEAHFGDKPHGDITKIGSKNIVDHDLLTAGFPCQAFSIMGDQKGFNDTRGTLFFEVERILRDKQPHSFLLENVKQLKSHDGGRTLLVIMEKLHGLGYHMHYKVLNALDYGLPQKRERIIIVGFKKNYDFHFPNPLSSCPSLGTVLEDDDTVDKKYFVSEKIYKSAQERVRHKKVFYPSIWHENKARNIGIHPYSCALRAGASHNYLLVNGKRRPTPRENLRLQGFPDDYPIVLSDGHIKKQTGNSVPINMIEAVARQMMKAMKKPPLVFKGQTLKTEETGPLSFIDDKLNSRFINSITACL